MPLYDFTCQDCAEVVELNVSYDMRDRPRMHGENFDTKCRGTLKREWLKPPVDGQAAYQMKGVVYQGDNKLGHIPGHFGKMAKRNRGGSK